MTMVENVSIRRNMDELGGFMAVHFLSKQKSGFVYKSLKKNYPRRLKSLNV